MNNTRYRFHQPGAGWEYDNYWTNRKTILCP